MPRLPPRKLSLRFEVEWTSEAWAEIRTLPAFERRPVMDAAAKLAGEAWKLSDAWRLSSARKMSATIQELRAEGGHRLLYRVVDSLPAPSPPRSVGARPRVQILCAIVTGSTGAAVARPKAGELRRRGAILRQIGGGIPHEVVRRAWLAEMRREARSRPRPDRLEDAERR